MALPEPRLLRSADMACHPLIYSSLSAADFLLWVLTSPPSWYNILYPCPAIDFSHYLEDPSESGGGFSQRARSIHTSRALNYKLRGWFVPALSIILRFPRIRLLTTGMKILLFTRSSISLSPQSTTNPLTATRAVIMPVISLESTIQYPCSRICSCYFLSHS